MRSTTVKPKSGKTKGAGRKTYPAWNEARYIDLLKSAMPLPPQTEDDNERLTKTLLELEDRYEALTPEELRFYDLLSILIEAFEDEHYPQERLPAHRMLAGIMEDRGLRHKDIAAIIGNKGLTSQIINGQREMSKEVIKKLSAALHVPADVFLA